MFTFLRISTLVVQYVSDLKQIFEQLQVMFIFCLPIESVCSSFAYIYLDLLSDSNWL